MSVIKDRNASGACSDRTHVAEFALQQVRLPPDISLLQTCRIFLNKLLK